MARGHAWPALPTGHGKLTRRSDVMTTEPGYHDTMRNRSRLAVFLAALAGSLLAIAAAAASLSSSDATVPTGHTARYPLPKGEWDCANRGTRIVCASGDAFPYVELTIRRAGGVTVIVHTLGRARPKVLLHGNAGRVYRFAALDD